MAVHIVGESYQGSEDRVRTISMGGLTVKLAGIEDPIVNRLVAAKYWRSNPQLDMEQALALLRTHRGP
jgi:hypothetical protein